MPDPLTDLQKEDLTELPLRSTPLYGFMERLLAGKVATPEIAQARARLEEVEFWIQQHIVRNGSGKSSG